MAQNSEAIFRLGLEVIGADAIKQAAAALRQFGAETKSIQPSRIETVIGAVDLATPVYAKVARSIRELGDTFVAQEARIMKSLEAQRVAYRLYAEEMGKLGVSNRLLRPVRDQVLGATSKALGLTPGEAESIQRSNQLYGQLGTAYNAIDKTGSDDYVIAEQARIRTLRATRAVAYLAPQVLGKDIIRNRDFRFVSRTAREGDLEDFQTVARLQRSIAQLAPLVAQRRHLELATAAFRTIGEQKLITATSAKRQGFEPLYDLESKYRSDPILTERLQSAVAIGDEPSEEDLRAGAFLLASRKRLVAQSRGLSKRRLSPLEIAQLLRIRNFGRTPDDAMQYLFTTGDVTARSEAQQAGGGVGPGQFLQTEATVYKGRYLDFMPQATNYLGGNYRGLRPRTQDIKKVPAGTMQEPPAFPRTPIETTWRVVPESEIQSPLITAAEQAASQSRAMIPEETVEERFRRINYQRGLENLEKRAAERAAKFNTPIPSTVQLPEEGESTRLNREEAEAEARLKQRRKRKGLLDLGEGGFARIRRSTPEEIDAEIELEAIKIKQAAIDKATTAPKPRMGRPYGSIGKEAENLIANFPRATIFPKTIGEKLNLDPSATASIIKSLQEQGFLGTESVKVGAVSGALPIISAQARRSSQIRQAEIESDLAKETDRLNQERRRLKNEEIIAKRGAGGGGGGIIPPTDDEETVPGSGGGDRKKPPPKEPPPLFSARRFASRFAGLTSFMASAAILYPIASILFQSVGASVELEANVKRIQAIYGANKLSDQLEIKGDIVKTAESLGENVNEVAKAAQQFAQAQIPLNLLGKDLQAAAIGAKAFGTNIKEVADYIIAIQATTGGKTTGLQAVDILASISQRTAVSPQALMASIQNVGPALEAFTPTRGNVSDQSLIGALTGVEAQYGRITGAQTAAALRFFIGRLGNPAAVAKIQDTSGVKLGTAESGGQDLKPFVEILGELSAVYERLLKQGRSGEAKELLQDLFGARQVAAGTIILSRFKDALGLVEHGLNDTGAAARLAAPQIETFQSAVNNLKTSITAIVELPAFTKLVDFVTKTIQITTGQKSGIKAFDFINNVDDKKMEFWKLVLDYLTKGTPARNLIEATIADPNSLLNQKRVAGGTTQLPLPTQSLMFQGQETTGGVVGGLTGTYSRTKLPTRFGQSVSSGIVDDKIPLDIPKTPDATLVGSPEIFDAPFRKYQKEGTAANAVLKNLGFDAENAKSKLAELKKLLIDFFSLSPAQQQERLGKFAQTRRWFATEDLTVAMEEIKRGGIRDENRISRAQLTAAGQITQTQIRATREGRIFKDLPTIGTEIAEVRAGQKTENTLALTDYLSSLKEIASVTEMTQGERTKASAIAFQEYVTQIRLNEIKADELELEIQIKTSEEQRLQNQKIMLEMSNRVFGAGLKGLQAIPEAIAGARTTRGASGFGAAMEALLGPVAGSLATNRTQTIQKGLQSGALLPGVRNFLGKSGGAVDPDQIAVIQYQVARGIMTPEVGAAQIKKLQGKAAETQAEIEVAQFAGQTISAATGGNSKNAQIGGEIGALAGTPFGPPGQIIGGLLGSLVGGLFGKPSKPPGEIGHLKIIADNSREQVRLLENTNKLLSANFVSFNVPTGFRLPSYQPGAFGGIAASRGAGGGGVVNSSIHVEVNVGGTNVSAEKLGSTIAQAISDRLELESRSSGGYFPRLLYG